MYHSSAQWSRNKRATRPFRPSSGRGRPGLSQRERVRLTQLAVCLVLFLTVFLGKGIFPQKLLLVQEQLRSILVLDTDFRGGLLNLGQSLSEKGAVWTEIGNLCVDVFGQHHPTGEWDSSRPMKEELAFLNRDSAPWESAAHYLRQEEVPKEWFQPVAEPQPPAVAVPPPTEIPAAGTVLIPANYQGIPLPENYTMDKLSLGDIQTVTPLLGVMSSPYGYRDHPIDRVNKFHNGVDIVGHMGADIGAFADGRVDYIGENDIHGMYLQLDHGNGVKSFYAHCSKLCVSKGQLVAAGEKVAEVGSTGVATGPHLHFEVKWNGLHLNPADYITFQAG